MHYCYKLKIADLNNESLFEHEITLAEAEKILGGQKPRFEGVAVKQLENDEPPTGGNPHGTIPIMDIIIGGTIIIDGAKPNDDINTKLHGFSIGS